ncbi:MAG: hypothetical protein Q7K57_14965 [Burkholderiaceae bacterium]|nr:hypothetical protein [Burkholderiaceae bacterium]
MDPLADSTLLRTRQAGLISRYAKFLSIRQAHPRWQFSGLRLARDGHNRGLFDSCQI